MNGKPLHTTDPKSSLFDVISFKEFESLSQIQERLRRKNIVVTGCPGPDVEFNEAGLRTLSPLDRIISIQGMTLKFQI